MSSAGEGVADVMLGVRPSFPEIGGILQLERPLSTIQSVQHSGAHGSRHSK